MIENYDPLNLNANDRQGKHKGNETPGYSTASKEHPIWKKEILSKLHSIDSSEESIRNKLDTMGGVNGILFELSTATLDKEENKAKIQEITNFYNEFEKIKGEQDPSILDSQLINLKNNIKNFFEENYKFKEDFEEIPEKSGEKL